MKFKGSLFWCLVGCVVALPLVATSEEAGSVTEGDLKIDHGQVNWTDRNITATGSGAPDLKAPNVAAARLGAERVAKLDALRNILEALKGVHVNSEVTVEKEMVTEAKIRSKVEGLARNFKVLKTKYYSDGGVDLVVQMSLDGSVGSTLVPPGNKSDTVPAKGDAKHTGLIIDARGLKLLPALSPKVQDESGGLIYSSELLDQKAMEVYGVAGYFKDIDGAKANKRVAPNPLVIKAMKLADGSKTDLVLSKADAAQLKDPAANMKFLAEGKVILVVD